MEPQTSVVSFLGPESSYTHQAALAIFDGSDCQYHPSSTISSVFDDVKSGKAAFGVVPFENSTNGAVIYTLDLIADRHKLYDDITICGEHYLNVSHFLLGHKQHNDPKPISTNSGACTPTPDVPNPLKPRNQPLSSLKHIERVYSHPQAFGQCELFLNEYLKGVPRIDTDSTSKAADIVKNDETGTSAAIASSIAAQVKNLDVLAREIEDKQDNTTRFLILRKGSAPRIMSSSVAKSKSLVTFMVDHDVPGALASVLECFHKVEINLTSINSRPTRVKPFQYIFLVEFEGSLLNEDGKVKEVFDAMKGFVKGWRWWGSWNDMLIEKVWREQVAD